MAGPPRDKDGRVQPHDDPAAIPDDSFVLRSIPSSELKARQDGPGRYLSSGAFSRSSKQHDPTQEMSTDAGTLMAAAGVPEKKGMRSDHEALVKIRAGDLRDLGCQIGPDPIHPDSPYHAQVWGVRGNKSKKIKQKAIWVIRPADVLKDLGC